MTTQTASAMRASQGWPADLNDDGELDDVGSDPEDLAGVDRKVDPRASDLWDLAAAH